MGLMYKEDNRIGIYSMSRPITPSLEQFATVERRVAEKRSYLEDVQNELALLEQQAVRLYSSQVEYLKFTYIDTKLVRAWMRMLKSGKDHDGNKLNIRKKCPEKEMYASCIHTLESYLGISGIELLDIVECGLHHEADSFEFRYMDHRWSINIPCIQNISLQYYKDLGNSVFKLEVYYHSGCMRYLVGSTFEEDDLSDIMKTGVEKFVKDGDPNEEGR